MPHMAPMYWVLVCVFVWSWLLVMFSKRWFGGFSVTFKV